MTNSSSSLGNIDSNSEPSVFYTIKKATVEGSGEERKVIIDLVTLHEKDNKSHQNFVTMTTMLTVTDDSLTDNQLINGVIKALGIRSF